MNDRPPRGTALQSLLLCLLLALWAIHDCAANEPSERPNIVLILADDLAWRDLGFMGNRLVHTPHIDRLARRSARFPNGYVPMSVCRPSLATLLTGLYPHQHGIHFNHPPPGLRAMRAMTARRYEQTRATTDVLIESVPTLPRVLAESGYACLQTGKHWEGSYRTAGFTHGMTLGKPARRLGQVTGTREQDNGEWVAHGNGDAGLIIGRETMQPIDDFVKAHAGQQPFFVWYAPFLPHTPFDAPQRFRDLYRDRDVPPHLLPYYAEIARFDETVGSLMTMLERQQALNNTLIVFISDNGFRPDEERHERQNQRSKLSQFDDGLRTPVLLSWSNHIAPAKYSQTVQSIDIVPTVLAAARASDRRTRRMQGVDLLGVALGTQSLTQRPAFGAIYPNDAEVLFRPSRHVRGRWVRDGDWKLIVPGPAKNPVPPALYNLDRDPLEQQNLLEQSEFAEVRHRLQQLLDEWWRPGDDSRVTRPVQNSN